MKFAAVLLATAAGLVAAQNVADFFPECSVKCLEDSVGSASDCTIDDAWCICVQKTYEGITTHATACVMKECGADVALGEVLPAAVPYCEAATAAHNGDEAKPTESSPVAGGEDPAPTTTPPPSATGSDDADADADGTDSEAPQTTDGGSGAGAKAVPAMLGMLALGAVAAL